MIIWSGWGFLSVVIGAAGLLVGGTVFERFLPQQYGVAIGLALAALVNYFVARQVDNPALGREMIDAKTGQRVVLRRRASLFFIPMRYWTYIILALALAAVFAAGKANACGLAS